MPSPNSNFSCTYERLTKETVSGVEDIGIIAIFNGWQNRH